MVLVAQRNSNKMETEKGRLNSTVRSLVLHARAVPVACWRWVYWLGGEAVVID